jgi:hypothetical protein
LEQNGKSVRHTGGLLRVFRFCLPSVQPRREFTVSDLLFLPSLVLGMTPRSSPQVIKPKHRPGIAVRRLWNSAIATLSAGMLVRAIINISGRYTEYDTIYWLASGLLVLAALISYIKQRVNPRPIQKPQTNEIGGF